ncbi:putative epidermal cell surface receptor [Pollicipes pollicipes]|uniref:putative epidermal cell surface receptor n=1 Tax=Pollicipes pollicipes TaxID=41117 RepID=UPI001884FF38|nr:putative epidermal cell surface receptor [Pollicipes pollicipes]
MTPGRFDLRRFDLRRFDRRRDGTARAVVTVSHEKKCRSDGECASDRFCLGGVCFDPCTLLDPCNSSLKNGVCRTRSHRPVCSCPQGFSFEADTNACVKVGCEDEQAGTVDVGERIFRADCEQTCVCGPGGQFNCTPTVCPPGFYRPGTFKDDPDCTELRGSAIAGGCCVNVVCANPEPPSASQPAGAAPRVADDESVVGSTGAACTYVVCGPGAACDGGLCSCRPGLAGDPNDLARGCRAAAREEPAAETTTSETTTSAPTTSATTTGKPTTAFAKTLDMLPLDITHNSTTLQLPSVGGELTYSADGRPPRTVRVKAGRRVKTVTDLQPGTTYAFTWKGADGEKTLSVDTRPGCVTNTSSFAIGETYHMGCQSTCVCGGPNQPSCRPRCSFTRGTVTDKACSERPDIDDPECCVQLVCAVSSTGGQIVEDLLDSISPTERTATSPSTSTAASPITTASPTTTTDASTTPSSSTTASPNTTAGPSTTAIPTTTASPSTTDSPSTTASPSTTDSPTTTAIPSTTVGASDSGESAVAPPGALTAGEQPKPTLIVTTKSYNSVTLAWDDFKPADYVHGYVAQYRQLGAEEWRRQELAPQPGQSVPLLRIDQLRPDTEYEARVSIYDSQELGTLGDASETIRFTTDDGCVDGNDTYPVGGRFYHGCEQTCFCELRGRARCVPRCQRPLFRHGAFSDDPLCFEKRMDECCVIAACASASAPPTDETEDEEEGSDPCSAIMCDENYVCERVKKEGENAEARTQAMCVCPPGFDETSVDGDKACKPGVTSPRVLANVTGCTYGNATYQPGDEFFDGCEFKCMCNSEEKIECQARCSRRASDDTAPDAGCRLVPDPDDPCCQTMLCERPDGESSPEPAGCVFEGREYAVNSTFEQGCEGRCRCLGAGEVACVPRCALQTPPEGATCTSRPDPADSCCNITVCTTATEPAPETTTETAPETTTETAPETTTETAPETTTETAPETTTEPAVVTVSSRLGAGRLEVGPPALRVAELVPVDATSTQLKLLITDSVLDSFLSAQTQPLLVEWRYDGGPWQARSIEVDAVSVETLDTLVMTVEGLQRPRAADVRVTYAGETSPLVRGADVVPADATEPPATTTEGRCGAYDPGFRCRDGSCIPLAQRCDFLYDCDDESDEASCDGLEETVGVTEAPPSDGFPTGPPLVDGACVHKGVEYQPGDEFHDGCRQFCMCAETGVMCARIRCPHRYGLSLINPDCLEWDMKLSEEPTPPNCCPEVTCKDDGSCQFEGQTFRNQHEIPQSLTGCERRCFCEFGNVTCQPDCPPVPEQPPASLPCPPEQALLLPGPNGCCQFWQCADPESSTPYIPVGPDSTELPPGLPLEDLELQVVDSRSVQVNFSIPRQLVGLSGKTEVLYTANAEDSDDLSSWDRRVFESPSGRMDELSYSWKLGDLSAGTDYLLRARVLFEQAISSLQSSVRQFSTPPMATPGTTLPPKVALDAGLVASEINTTWARIGWRRLTEDELRFIDGIQLRYRDVDVDAQVWTMTPFIHRELTTYELTELKPDTGYEVDIVLMPFQNQNTEMVSERPLRIRTPPVVDLYDFNVTLLLNEPSANSVRVRWSGIPQPQYKYVNVYRIVYIYEKEREEKHTFKLAKTSDQPTLLLKGLKPSSKYQVWLEAYLKNGKKRVSEVQEFVTKAGELGKAEQVRGSESEAGAGQLAGTNYFSGMVAAAVIAAVAILLCLIAAVMLARKSSHAKAPITPARKNGPSYENPAFKTSDLDLNGSNGNDRFA